jgi:hypothetical protein
VIAVTHCEEGKIHADFTDGSGKGFDLLIGISSPEDSGPEFLVQNGIYNSFNVNNHNHIVVKYITNQNTDCW